jgi:hypothetical protein
LCVSGRSRRALWSWVGWGVVALSWVGVVVTATTAQSKGPSRQLSLGERTELGQRLAHNEASWRQRSWLKFPGDCWSADDDFFNQEQAAVLAMAKRNGAPVGDVLLGIDEELRARPAGRKVTVCPLKPRPFYD